MGKIKDGIDSLRQAARATIQEQQEIEDDTEQGVNLMLDFDSALQHDPDAIPSKSISARVHI